MKVYVTKNGTYVFTDVTEKVTVGDVRDCTQAKAMELMVSGVVRAATPLEITEAMAAGRTG